MSVFTSRVCSLAFVLAGTAGLLTAPAVSADSVADSPPGANHWSCKPSARHPFPVILVPGTFESMAKNWVRMSPYLKDKGYCVFALNYGERHHVYATGPIQKSAKRLARFVSKVRAATHAKQVDLVGHSQGGMMPRYYMRFLGGARKVNALIGIAPSNHGTRTPLLPPTAASAPAPCRACTQQGAGSAFLKKLNAGGDLVHGPFYTVISTTHDEVVTPYRSQALAGPRSRVTNIVIQHLCPNDPIEHDQTPNDPVVQQLVNAALRHNHGPANPRYRPTCT